MKPPEFVKKFFDPVGTSLDLGIAAMKYLPVTSGIVRGFQENQRKNRNAVLALVWHNAFDTRSYTPAKLPQQMSDVKRLIEGTVATPDDWIIHEKQVDTYFPDHKTSEATTAYVVRCIQDPHSDQSLSHASDPHTRLLPETSPYHHIVICVLITQGETNQQVDLRISYADKQPNDPHHIEYTITIEDAITAKWPVVQQHHKGIKHFARLIPHLHKPHAAEDKLAQATELIQTASVSNRTGVVVGIDHLRKD